MDGKQTEEHIKETAKNIFFAKGRLGAKTQEIADEAGVNRAMLHYYFRTREKLFDTVLKEALDESYREMYRIMSSESVFEKKIQDAVSHIIDQKVKYPYMENFMIGEIIKKPECVIDIKKEYQKKDEVKKKFMKEIQHYIDEHKLPHIKPEHFIVNMMSLCSYPSIAKPFLQNLFRYNEEQYKKFIQERKQVVAKLLLGKNLGDIKQSY